MTSSALSFRGSNSVTEKIGRVRYRDDFPRFRAGNRALQKPLPQLPRDGFRVEIDSDPVLTMDTTAKIFARLEIRKKAKQAISNKYFEGRSHDSSWIFPFTFFNLRSSQTINEQQFVDLLDTTLIRFMGDIACSSAFPENRIVLFDGSGKMSASLRSAFEISLGCDLDNADYKNIYGDLLQVATRKRRILKNLGELIVDQQRLIVEKAKAL